MGFLRYTPPDVSRVTRFRVYKASGMPLKQTVANNEWESITIAGTSPNQYYQTSVALEDKRLSWIRYEIQIDSGQGTDIVGEVSFDSVINPEIDNMTLDWNPLTRNVRMSYLADEDVEGVIYAYNKTGVNGLNNAAYTASRDASRFRNGNNRQIVAEILPSSGLLLPGETIHVGIRPFSVEVTDSTSVTANRGEDYVMSLRIPSTGELPTWELDHSKDGSTVHLDLTVFDPTANASGNNGLVTRVQYREARGRPITEGMAYANIPNANVSNVTRGTRTGRKYRRSMNLRPSATDVTTKRDSYIQFKIVTVAGVDDIVLDPFVIDADNNPEAVIGWDYRWDEDNSNWDFIVAWAGDDDLQSIEFELQIPPRTDTSPERIRSNMTQDSDEELQTDIMPNTEWRLVVKGWDKDDGWDSSVTDKIENTILIQTGKTPPGQVELPVIGESNVVTFQDRIDLIEARFRDIAEAARNWSSEDIVFTSSGRTVSWTEGSITVGSASAVNISSGSGTVSAVSGSDTTGTIDTSITRRGKHLFGLQQITTLRLPIMVSLFVLQTPHAPEQMQ